MSDAACGGSDGTTCWVLIMLMLTITVQGLHGDLEQLQL